MTDNEEPLPTVTAIDDWYRHQREQREAGRRAIERQRVAERQRRMAWNQVTDALRFLATENYDEARQCLGAALTFLAAADHTESHTDKPDCSHQDSRNNPE
jgi:hypothetical protein